MPAELDEVERRRMQLEIEREALRKEKDAASKARLEALEKELADLRERGRRAEAAMGEGEGGRHRHPRESRSSWSAQAGDRGRRARRRLRQGGELKYGPRAELEKQLAERRQLAS